MVPQTLTGTNLVNLTAMVPGKCTADTNRVLGYQPRSLTSSVTAAWPDRHRTACEIKMSEALIWRWMWLSASLREVHKRDSTWQCQSSCRANALCGTSPGLIFWERELLGLWLLLSPSLSLTLLFLVLITDLAPAMWGGNKSSAIHTPAT